MLGERRESDEPFSFSLEPPRDSLDIMRCKRPDLLLEDSSEIILGLALMVGGGLSSSGGPSSRKSMRSLADFDM